jgi:hypothetical protein
MFTDESTVKEPTKRTSPRHDHLCKELASRQHNRFCVSESNLHNKQSWDNFVSFTTRSRTRQIDDGNEDSSIADTILPPGWTMHRPMFHWSKQEGEWSTFLGRSTFTNQVVYPNFVSRLEGDIFESGESEWVQASVNRADELGFSRVDVFCGAIIPTEWLLGDQNMSRQSTDLFRCHPSFHSYCIPTCNIHGMIEQWLSGNHMMERNLIIWWLLVCYYSPSYCSTLRTVPPPKGDSSDILSIQIETPIAPQTK